jgi:EpsI family protein
VTPSVVRPLVLAGLFLGATGYVSVALRPEVVPVRQPLDTLPVEFGRWQGQDAPPFDPEVLRALGADDYVNRVYRSRAEPPVAVYVGYYKSQREGDTIHSPLNCLPGAGWQPLTAARVRLRPASAEPAVVNRLLIQKGLDRQVVLYWYQSHGRIVASEYASKAWLIYDALRHHRSDAALVRVISPVLPSEDDDRPAEGRTVAFAQALLPLLARHLPA